VGIDRRQAPSSSTRSSTSGARRSWRATSGRPTRSLSTWACSASRCEASRPPAAARDDAAVPAGPGAAARAGDVLERDARVGAASVPREPRRRRLPRAPRATPVRWSARRTTRSCSARCAGRGPRRPCGRLSHAARGARGARGRRTRATSPADRLGAAVGGADAPAARRRQPPLELEAPVAKLELVEDPTRVGRTSSPGPARPGARARYPLAS
jgi:hypothetical protein